MEKLFTLCLFLAIMWAGTTKAYAFTAKGPDEVNQDTITSCECEKGIPELTVEYWGESDVTVNIYASKDHKNLIQTFENVQKGEFLKLDGSAFMEGSLKTERYYEVVETGVETVNFHTSCSEDILGQTKGNFTVVSYTDAKGNHCDSGLEPFEASLQVEDAICGESGNGAIDVTVTGGESPYAFSWSNGDTTEDLTGVDAGTYDVTIEDQASRTLQRSATVEGGDPVQVSTKVDYESCSEARIFANASGGTAPYSYQWANGDTASVTTVTESGEYQVTATDANGCEAVKTINIDEFKGLEIASEVTEPQCFEESNGAIDISVTGGSGEYTYEWSNGATTQDLDSIDAGVYDVTVTDTTGCYGEASITVSQPAAISISPEEINDVSCQGDDGSIEVQVTGGNGVYDYEWSNGDTTRYIDSLSTGDYSLTVTDTNGCSQTKTFTIDELAPLEATIAGDSVCNDGRLSLNISGGESPYTYEWSNGSTSGAINPTDTGMYWVEVTDANGCVSTDSLEIQSFNSVEITAEKKHPTCHGAEDGSINLTLEGDAPLEIEWGNGATTEELTGLSGGTYTVTVTDSSGCSKTRDITLEEPAPVTVDVKEVNDTSCPEAEDGAIDIAVSGGDAPYTYHWSNGATTEDIDGLAPGDYHVAVEDSSGCFSDTTRFTINAGEPEPVSASINCCEEDFINQGETANINVEFTGNGPWTFTYTDGVQEKTVTTSSNPYQLAVSPEQTTSYQLVSVQDACSAGEVCGEATIGVNQTTSKNQSCGDNCFTSEVVEQTTDGKCKKVKLKVTAGEDCAHALSHFTVSGGCGEIIEANNSEKWPIEYVENDPTTQLSGFKVDEIQNFGESAGDSFTVTYTVCNENENACSTSVDQDCDPLVAYKAGLCVYYGEGQSSATTDYQMVADDTDEMGSTNDAGDSGDAQRIKLYPNPSDRGDDIQIDVSHLKNRKYSIQILDNSGLEHYRSTFVKNNLKEKVSISNNLKAGVYYVIISTPNNKLHKRIIIR